MAINDDVFPLAFPPGSLKLSYVRELPGGDFLETQQFQIEEVVRWFALPSHMLEFSFEADITYFNVELWDQIVEEIRAGRPALSADTPLVVEEKDATSPPNPSTAAHT